MYKTASKFTNRVAFLRKSPLIEKNQKRKIYISDFKEGLIVKGDVVRIEEYGAFIEYGGIQGLLHISEMSHKTLAHPSALLMLGQSVNVRIIQAQSDANGKFELSFSMKDIRQEKRRKRLKPKIILRKNDGINKGSNKGMQKEGFFKLGDILSNKLKNASFKNA